MMAYSVMPNSRFKPKKGPAQLQTACFMSGKFSEMLA